MDLQPLEEAGYTARHADTARDDLDGFELLRHGEQAFRGHYYPGSRHIDPWIELHCQVGIDPENDRQRQLFTAFADILKPGSHIMVHYRAGDGTAEALNVEVPPPATPVGLLLWQAGFRWFKDWYISEGFREGGQKLQANLPTGEDVRQQREQETRDELRQFLDQDDRHPDCRQRARTVLASIDGKD